MCWLLLVIVSKKAIVEFLLPSWITPQNCIEVSCAEVILVKMETGSWFLEPLMTLYEEGESGFGIWGVRSHAYASAHA